MIKPNLFRVLQNRDLNQIPLNQGLYVYAAIDLSNLITGS